MKTITTLSLGIIFLTTGVCLAQQAQPAQQSSVQPVEVGNKHCPVSGNEVGQMGAPIKVEYNGKIYNLCCPGCRNAFKNNPEKFSKIADNDAKTAN